MKRTFKLSLVCSAVLLSACGDDTSNSGFDSSAPYEAYINESLERDSSISFSLLGAGADVPLPSYLLFDTNDHTLELPVDADSTGQLNDPVVAMGETDGWSPMMPFSINLNLEQGVTLKNDFAVVNGTPFSANLNNGFKLAKVTVDLSTGAITFVEELMAGVDFLVTSTDLTSINVVPLKGLEPGTDYVFAITDDIVDSNDEPLGMSPTYASLKTELVEQTGDLATPQALAHQIEMKFEENTDAIAESIIYSSWFTTASAGQVMLGTKTAMAISADPNVTPAGVWKGTANPNDISAAELISLYSVSVNDTLTTDFGTAVENDALFINAFGSDTAAQLKAAYDQATALGVNIQVYRGYAMLPYFLSDDTDGGWATTPWRSGMPSVLKILNVLSSGSDEDKAAIGTQLAELGITDPATQLLDPTYQALLVGAELSLADGSQLDAERILTRYSAVPQVRSVKQVPFIMFVPQGVGAVDVLQFQHGITSLKESSYLFALQHISGSIQASNPYAVIAIDQPLHGERGLSSDIVTTPDNPTVFMNLEYLPVARDNIRQGAIDTLGMRYALTKADDTVAPFDTIDSSSVSLFGHSIGAITGISSYTVANTAVNPAVDPAFMYNNVTLANPGGGIAPFLLESGSFSPLIKHSVIAASVPTYAEHYATNCVPNNIDAGTCYTTFYNGLDENDPQQAALKAGIDAGLTEFSYAAQTVLDNVDPFNVATLTNEITDAKIFGIQASGDSTIPNSVATTPTAGTEPLFTKLVLENVLTSSSPKIAAYFNEGSGAEHSSVIAAGSAAEVDANEEMTSQVIQFTVSGSVIPTKTNLLE